MKVAFLFMALFVGQEDESAYRLRMDEKALKGDSQAASISAARRLSVSVEGRKIVAKEAVRLGKIKRADPKAELPNTKKVIPRWAGLTKCYLLYGVLGKPKLTAKEIPDEMVVELADHFEHTLGQADNVYAYENAGRVGAESNSGIACLAEDVRRGLPEEGLCGGETYHEDQGEIDMGSELHGNWHGSYRIEYPDGGFIVGKWTPEKEKELIELAKQSMGQINVKFPTNDLYSCRCDGIHYEGPADYYVKCKKCGGLEKFDKCFTPTGGYPDEEDAKSIKIMHPDGFVTIEWTDKLPEEIMEAINKIHDRKKNIQNAMDEIRKSITVCHLPQAGNITPAGTLAMHETPMRDKSYVVKAWEGEFTEVMTGQWKYDAFVGQGTVQEAKRECQRFANVRQVIVRAELNGEQCEFRPGKCESCEALDGAIHDEGCAYMADMKPVLQRACQLIRAATNPVTVPEPEEDEDKDDDADTPLYEERAK